MSGTKRVFAAGEAARIPWLNHAWPITGDHEWASAIYSQREMKSTNYYERLG
jgi:hypothetical protein